MVYRGYVRKLGALVGALLATLLLAAGPVMAEDPSSCSVNVDPQAAAGGSIFTFSGSGFTPSRFSLQKNDGAPIVNDLSLGGADPWQATVQSRAGDEGTWTAIFLADGGCAASAVFEVTLSSTDVISDLLGTPPAGQQPVLAYLLVAGFGLTGGIFLARRLAAAQSQPRQ